MRDARLPLILGTLLSLAFAQNLSGQPACASSCLISAFSVAGCVATDIACQCGTGQAAIATAATPCLISSCNATELSLAEQIALGQCSAYSASLTSSIFTPTQSSSKPSSTSASSRLSSFSSFSTTPAPSFSSTGTQTSSSSAIGTPSGTSNPISESQTPSATSKSSGLSTGAKAGIGVGVTLGVLLFASFGAFAFWYGKRSATRKKEKDDEPATIDKPELGPGIPRRKELEDTSVPLNAEEKAELERRRRAAELEGSLISPVELPTERAELDALRSKGNVPLEMD